MMGKEFNCDCGGLTQRTAEDKVMHACTRKYPHATSYYDGVPKFAEYHRIQINPKLTEGREEYNWFLSWE